MTTLRSKGPEVLLSVTVRDKHGDLVKDLTSADVTLSEDGRPQQIKSFARDSDASLRLGLADRYQPQPSGSHERRTQGGGQVS